MCAGYYLEESNALKSIAYAAQHHPIKEQMRERIPPPEFVKNRSKNHVPKNEQRAKKPRSYAVSSPLYISSGSPGRFHLY